MGNRAVKTWLATALLMAGTSGAALAADNGLISAARHDNSAKAMALIEKGADVKAKAVDGSTALQWAAYNDDVALVKRLLKAGADPNAKNDYGATPMSAAAIAADPAVIKLLLKAGADPDSLNADGQTALMVVARSGNVEAAKELIKRGAHVNAVERWRHQTALMWAAAKRRPEMVALLIKHGAKPDLRSVVNNWKRQISGEPRAQYRDAGGLTALLYAAREDCEGCAKALIEGGADINLPDPRGVTPLVMAINNLHFNVAKYLIETGADPNKWDWWGRSPLYSAVDMNTLPNGGREDRPSLDATTPLDIIKLLLDSGANPNLQLKLFPPYRQVEDDRGCDRILTVGATPLLRAAKAFDAKAIKLLLAHGAKVNMPNVNGVTPVMAAAGEGSVECDTRGDYLTPDVQKKSIDALKPLLAAGGDINASDDRKRGRFSDYREQTALHGAAFWGWNKVVAFLVEHGARIDVKDKNGMTPLNSAMGRAGGHGRGQRIEVHEKTAALLRELCAKQPSCSLPEPKEGEKTAKNL